MFCRLPLVSLSCFYTTRTYKQQSSGLSRLNHGIASLPGVLEAEVTEERLPSADVLGSAQRLHVAAWYILGP